MALLLGLPGCDLIDKIFNTPTPTPTASPAATPAPVKVGAVLPGGSDRWALEAAEMRAAAPAAGVILTMHQSATVSADQCNQFAALVADGNKVILVAAINGEDTLWSTARIAATSAGVIVVAYDRALACADLYYSFDNTEIGRMQGAWLVSKISAGDYYILRGASTDGNSALFASGALEKINAIPGITVLNSNPADQTVENWDPTNAKNMVAALLATHVPTAILAPNDGTAGGVATAISSSSIAAEDKTRLLGALTGQDGSLEGLKRIYHGKQGMTISKSIKRLAANSIPLCAQLANGATIASLSTGTYFGKPVHFLTSVQDPNACFVVDLYNMKAKADAGALLFTWAEITAP
jgi:D-xylose transport system substrate-binding protein